MRHILLGFGVAMVLGGCGDPLRDVPRLSDVAVEDGAATVTQTAAEARNTEGGLFGRLLNRTPQDPTNAAVESALADAQAQTRASPPQSTQRGGLFGLFRSNQTSVQTAPAVEVTDVLEDPTGAEVVAVAVPQATAEPPRRGLAGLFRRTPDRGLAVRTGPDTQDVAPGTVMPFGQIARVCGLRGSDFGTQVDAASGYRIFDTIPNSTAPRPFYVTGFEDNCARTFTGAVVVTGDVETHEFVRYRPSNQGIEYTTTDNAYEALKASACRVGRGQPCGANTRTLDRNTHFITVYNFFGGTFSAVPTQWAQILVHDGEVLAMSIKDGQ